VLGVSGGDALSAGSTSLDRSWRSKFPQGAAQPQAVELEDALEMGEPLSRSAKGGPTTHKNKKRLQGQSPKWHRKESQKVATSRTHPLVFTSYIFSVSVVIDFLQRWRVGTQISL
jgi:hypothetical protein